MSDVPKQYRSRLQQRNTQAVRGIGSGYAHNQKMAGAEDPQQAKEEATKSESASVIEADESEKRDRELGEMAEDITLAINEGVFTLPSDVRNVPSDSNDLPAFIRSRGVADIEKWHALVQVAYDERVEQDDAETLRNKFQDMDYIEPSDPLYDPLRDNARRRRIEEHIKPLDFEEMVFRGYTRQDITLRPNFTITLRTLPTQHGLWLEWMMAQTEESSVQHTRHLFSLMQLAASLDFVNGKSVGSDITKYYKDDDASRESFQKAIQERMEFLGRMPSALTDDFIIQSVWFNGRVRRVLAGDLMRKVGNY